jgi:hypothetical protein
LRAVALAAVTVKVELDPAAMEAGLAAMLTVAAAGGGSVGPVEISPALALPHPVIARKRESSNNAAKGERIL